jgi:hypothetical protein
MATATPPRADAGPPTEGPEFERLVRDILEEPERVLDAALTAEQLLALQRRLNPYRRMGAPADPARKTVVACSYTNLREAYLRRFTMTSLVGFLFQLYHEWEVPAHQRRWVPGAADEGRPYAPGELARRLEAALDLAREADAAAAAAERDPSEEAAARRAGLLYAATYAAHSLGADAAARLCSTAGVGAQYAAVREALAVCPLPRPPGEVEVPSALAKEVIGAFLRHWLEFDPSRHVRSGHDPKALAEEAAQAATRMDGVPAAADPADPHRLTLDAVLAAAPAPVPEHREAVDYILETARNYDAVAALLRDGDLAEAAQAALRAPDAFRRYLFPVAPGSGARAAAEHVPPQDTYHRWAYYTEVNYEELRTVTEALYPERPDLDLLVAPWEVFAGAPEEVERAFDEYCEQREAEAPAPIKALELGVWTFLADFKANREKAKFYNKNTEVLRRILDRYAADAPIGAELMRNRVRQAKADEIAALGPDAAGLKEYRRVRAEQGRDLGARGAERVISPLEMKRLERAQGDRRAAKELELLEQTEQRVRELRELEAARRAAGLALADAERRELAQAEASLAGMRDMANVPDDAIRVDVFTTDAAAGNFTKTHFYTKAEEPAHLAPERWEGGAPSSMRGGSRGPIDLAERADVPPPSRGPGAPAPPSRGKRHGGQKRHYRKKRPG